MADFGEYKIVKTKKEHRCITCNRKIPKGKMAHHYNGMWEGDWQNSYMCIPCEELNVCGNHEEICGEEFDMWLFESEHVECPKCSGTDSSGYRHSYHSKWSWSKDLKTVNFKCEICGHEWEKFIGFDSIKGEV